MTDTANPTPGPYEIRVGALHKLYSKSARLEILTADQVSTWNVDGHSYSVKGDEANKNIHLAKDAFEVFQETNLTPRQLLEQRDGLQERVMELEGHIDNIYKHSCLHWIATEDIIKWGRKVFIFDEFLHRKFLTIKMRRDGVESSHEGDWLTYLGEAIRRANAALAKHGKVGG